MATLAEPQTSADPLDDFRSEVRDWLGGEFSAVAEGQGQCARQRRGADQRNGGDDRVARGDGRKGLGRADLAEGIWRRRARARRRRAC